MSQAEQDARGHARNAWLWSALLVAGTVWGSWTLVQHGPRPQSLPLSAWLDGSAGTALNKALRLPAQSSLETGQAALRYRLLGDAGPQVALGCPQWMFYRDGLRAQPGAGAAPFEARQRLVSHWTRQLHAQGIQVLVVAVPDKSRIESAHLCGLPEAPVMRERLDQWQQWLHAQGIAFADLRPAMQNQPGPMFLRTDVHMNAEGAQAAAQAVARAALPLLGGVRGTQAFQQSPPAPPQPIDGDLLILSGLRHAAPGWRPQRDLVSHQEITPVRSGGLLDDTPPVQVLLAGSSNGLRSHFAARLGIGLGREVWNLSMDGGQFSGAMLAALQRRASWPASLKLVIWEFSENTLSLPLTDGEKAALQALKPASPPA
ncbi:alginate O-acetyltransferase AlgX-related protein [Delftia sp. PS-11]|uniref:alginate O-acetyltransferase AlgX-related protein n=1 Tax=Delftia sp. PS-11 TaxID=2767222 RepID=UPI002458D438|nr:cell division protein FtsQ [Delftia sp. PS-11]KAJ8742252.1 cell division protein FtsQ [Delftia sp. PS-11]